MKHFLPWVHINVSTNDASVFVLKSPLLFSQYVLIFKKEQKWKKVKITWPKKKESEGSGSNEMSAGEQLQKKESYATSDVFQAESRSGSSRLHSRE